MPYRSLRDPSTLERLVVNIHQGIYITTESGIILDANPAFLEMVGVDTLVRLKRFQAGDLLVDQAERALELAILQTEETVRDFELRLRRADGEVLTVLDTAYVVTDEGYAERLFHGILIDITERKRLEEKLRELSVRDPLTGCFNRRRLEELEVQLRTQDSIWGAIVVDIDGFKRFNDVHGHQAGDEALVRVSRFLNGSVRSEDTVIRYGGDEFVLIVAGTIPEATEIVAHRMESRATLACPVPFSFGWSIRVGSETLQETIDRADHRLIQVKIRARERERRAAPSQPLPITLSTLPPAPIDLAERRRGSGS